MAVIGRGWKDSTICSIVGNQLAFSGAGFVINDYTTFEHENNISVEATFLYNDLDIGLILWYNEGVGYIKYILNSLGFSIIRVYNGNEVPLRYAAFADITSLTPPVAPESLTVKVEIYRTNIKCYYNSALIFNIEQNTFDSGTFGLYGTDGAICTAFTAQSNATEDWATVLGDGAIISEDGSITIISAGTATYVHQDITTVISQKYTVSVSHTSDIFITAHDGTSEVATDTFAGSGTGSLTFTATTTSTNIRVGRSTAGTSVISLPQVENKDFATSFAEETRENGYISFPTGNMNRYAGGLSIWINPRHSYTSGTLPIFYYNDTFKMVFTGGNFTLTYGAQTLTVAYTLVAGTAYHVIAVWDNTSGLHVNIYNGEADTTGDLVITPQTIEHSDSIYIGGTLNAGVLDVVGNMIMDTLVVYSGLTTVNGMKLYRIEPLPDSSRIAIKTDFSGGTLDFSRNRIIIPNPKPFTPIIVEDAANRIYERVYFLDAGRYVTYNKETFAYNTAKTFTVEYSDIINVRAYDATHIYSNITVSGANVTVGDLVSDTPGVTIQYTPRNVFCASYNKEANGYELYFGNLYGEAITITYENLLGEETKFVTTVEANPFKSANNNGFVYVTQTAIPVTSLDVKVTPSALVADGYQTATITIDCVGNNGVPTSNATISVGPTHYGTVTKYVSEEEQAFITAFNAEAALNGEAAAIEKYGYFVTDEHMSGRYIYKYRVNNITVPGTYIENLVIIDTKSGIGIEVPIRIVSKS